MMQVNISQAKTQLSRLIERAEAGEEVVVARAGKPVVKLVALSPEKKAPRVFGQDQGKFWIADDFDEIPEDILDAFEGKGG